MQENSSFDVKGFKSFPAHRKSRKNANSRRGYGGVIVYVRHEIEDSVEVLSKESEKIWLLFDKTKLGLAEDLLICACYVIPANSSAQAHIDVDMFDLVSVDIRRFKDLHPSACMLICADWNGRTGELDDFVRYDNPVHLPLPNNYIADNEPLIARVNQDKVITSYGRRLINDVCIATNCRILNGRINPDKQMGGRKTCITHRGTSTVDYVLCSADHMNTVKYFEVKDINEFSDHCPITFAVEANIEHPEKQPGQIYHKMKWEDSKKDEYLRNLSNPEIVFKFEQSAFLIDHHDENDPKNHVNSVINQFLDALHSATAPLFKRRINPEAKPKNRSKPDWADEDWELMKHNFLRSKDKFYRNQSDPNRKQMVSSRTSYKKYKDNMLNKYETKETKKLLEARLKNIKAYWDMLKGKTNKDTSYKISNNDFKEFYMKLSDPGDEFYTPDQDVKDELKQFLENELECAFLELNAEISHDEIKKAIKDLKPGKSSGEDLLLNEFYLHGKEILLPYLHKLFNYVFDQGIFPDSWSEGILVPLYKSGSHKVPGNFQGITLLSTLGKLFTRVLNTRFCKWAESYSIYVEAQYGFRSGRGTVDCMYILHNAITSFINNGKPLYAFFVDFSKAFDRVVYENLWLKMLKLGINGKIFNIVHSMYECVKTRVFTDGIKSDPFYCTLGVRQGKCLSPFLFAMYVNDL